MGSMGPFMQPVKVQAIDQRTKDDARIETPTKREIETLAAFFNAGNGRLSDSLTPHVATRSLSQAAAALTDGAR